jgi:hypothetical protein
MCRRLLDINYLHNTSNNKRAPGKEKVATLESPTPPAAAAAATNYFKKGEDNAGRMRRRTPSLPSTCDVARREARLLDRRPREHPLAASWRRRWGWRRLDGEMVRGGEEKRKGTRNCHICMPRRHGFTPVWTYCETQTAIRDLSDTLREFVDRDNTTPQV